MLHLGSDLFNTLFKYLMQIALTMYFSLKVFTTYRAERLAIPHKGFKKIDSRCLLPGYTIYILSKAVSQEMSSEIPRAVDQTEV